MSRAPHLLAGRAAERLAARHLQAQGLRVAEHNYRCRLGEIDLIMRDGDVLVFVEVRYRRDHHFGGALGSVTRAKQAKLMAAARAYLGQRGDDGTPCRFDVVTVTGRNYDYELRWIRNAFGQD